MFSCLNIFFSTIFVDKCFYNYIGDFMKVKIFDEEYEKDLEDDINNFLNDMSLEVVDIKYQVSTSVYSEEQIYCFSAMIIYIPK